MKTMKGFTIIELLIVMSVVFGTIGWVWNLVKVVSLLSCPLTLETVFRVISVFVFFVGAVIGYIPTGSGC